MAKLKIATVTLNPAIDRTVSIPNFKAGAVNRVEREQSDAGGKGVNVASVLADYGLAVAVTGFLGEENTLIFERLFAQKKIEDRFVRIAGRTRTGIKIIDEITQETTDLNFPGQAPTSDNVAQLFQIVEELTADCQWFVLAGSLPAGVSPEIYGELVTLIKSKGRAVALDTSGPALHQALPAGPSLIKPNNFELQEYVGRPLESQAAIIFAAQALLAEGIETVVVSMGAQGAIFVAADEIVSAKPPQVVVKSTVGAGDAMVSGTVAGKAQGLSLAECARLGTAFSVSAISQVGSGLPSPEMVEQFKQQVVIHQLN
ncbi:MAG TPA: 1-phosphofructokinase [Anaerolineae bacterium]|nr:1-phosphofructokinase [Anaerolineae bacterium]